MGKRQEQTILTHTHFQDLPSKISSSNDTLVVMSTPCAQNLVSKYLAPIQIMETLEEVVDSRTGA